MLQSLFTWIFYLFLGFVTGLNLNMLQSLFIWIFYLFYNLSNKSSDTITASILIHLDFLSIYTVVPTPYEYNPTSFNPYSSGFSIYFLNGEGIEDYLEQLQSLFTWIFYLFRLIWMNYNILLMASILIHLDFLSI